MSGLGDLDKKIREQQKKKDESFDQEMKKHVEEEEEVLKSYFKGLKQPLKEDPTLVRRKKYDEKMGTYRQVMNDIQPKKMVKDIIDFQAQTPEEIETIYDCKQYVKYRALECIPISLAATSAVSYLNRRYLTYATIGFGVFVGVGSGVILTFLRSTKYILQRFEDLGPDYYLGRLAQQEIEDYRMDKEYKKSI